MSDSRRLNIYTCRALHCGKQLTTEDTVPGTTPFLLPCICGGTMESSFYKVPEHIHTALIGKQADIEWYVPTKREMRKLSQPMREHVKAGGLVYRLIGPGAQYLDSNPRRLVRHPQDVATEETTERAAQNLREKAVASYQCPACGALEKQGCLSPAGKTLRKPHKTRVAEALRYA